MIKNNRLTPDRDNVKQSERHSHIKNPSFLVVVLRRVV